MTPTKEETTTTAPAKPPAPAKLKFAVWKGDPPPVEGRKVREPTAYDDIIKQSYDEGKSFSAEIPDVEGFDLADVLKSQVRALRSAAKFHGIGVDVRIVGERTLWFLGRDKRERQVKPADNGAAPTAA